MWPLSVTCWNLLGHLRMMLPALGLLCIIPRARGPNGPGGEPSDFQPFMDIFADNFGVDDVLMMAPTSKASCH